MNEQNATAETTLDLLILIGRFQPLHQGHVEVMRQALARARRLLVLVGSANRPRCRRNPFTAAERIATIQAAFPAAEAARVNVAPLDDVPEDDGTWARKVREAAQACVAQHVAGGARIGLVGHDKDPTSYYLQLFPGWEVIAVANHRGLNAGDLRLRYWQQGPAAITADDVPAPVHQLLERFATTPDFTRLAQPERRPDMLRHNLILDTDSYKLSHFLQYPPGTEGVNCYIEPRGGKLDDVVFFGLQIGRAHV
jgi:bifunctional NMN adenylyltransferase/nudix hydrolase